MSLKVPGLCLCTLLLWTATAAGTREDLNRLDQQTTSLAQQVQQLSVQMAQLQKSIQTLSTRLDAVERSAQTADLRVDLDGMKRQIEMLSSQMAALSQIRESTPAGVPAGPVAPSPATPLATSPPAPAIGSGQPASKPSAALPSPAAAVSPDLYNQAYSDYIQGNYNLAADEFRQFMDAFPADVRAGNSQYWIGECFYSQKKYPEAREAFQSVLDKYPQGNKVLAARLKLGLTLVAMDDTAGGMAALKALVQAAPNSDEALIAKDRLAKLQSP